MLQEGRFCRFDLADDIARWGTCGALTNVPAGNLVNHPENISFELAAVSWMPPVGGPSFKSLTESMAPGGIVLAYGALSTEPTPFPLFTLLVKSLTSSQTRRCCKNS